MAVNKHFKQKGAVAILIAVVMLVVILFIAITVSSIIAVSQQSSSRLSDSIKAYQAADSGLEYGLKLFSDFMAVDPFINVMTLKDFLEYSDEFDDNYIEGNDSYNKRQFCSGNSTKWIVIDQIEFCLEPKADVLDNIFVMQAVGRSGLTRRAVGVRLPVSQTIACFIREGCPDYGNDGVGLEAGKKCKLNRSGTVDPLYPEYENAEPYPEEDVCCNTPADCDKIAGGIDFGNYKSGDLVKTNKQSAFVIEGLWNNPDTRMTSVNGGPSANAWKTDKDHFITIFTRGQARHNGVYNDSSPGPYRIEYPWSAPVFWVDVASVKIDGIQIKLNNSPTSHAFRLQGTDNSQISNNIIKGANQPLKKGIWIENGNDNNRIFNNIIYDFQAIGSIGIDVQGTNNMVYNNTIYNAETGIQTGIIGETKLINNIVSECIAPFSGIFSFASYNTWDNNGGAPVPNNVGNIDATVMGINFRNISNENFLLSSGDVSSQNNGQNLMPDPANDPALGLYFTEDIEGDTRPAWNTSWDRGADDN